MQLNFPEVTEVLIFTNKAREQLELECSWTDAQLSAIFL